MTGNCNEQPCHHPNQREPAALPSLRAAYVAPLRAAARLSGVSGRTGVLTMSTDPTTPLSAGERRLRETLDRARAAVAKLDPVWVAAVQAWLKPVTDSCHRPRACDEAQTCVGGCVYGNRH